MSTPATIDHLPGKLNLKFRQGNDFSSTVQIGTKSITQDGKVLFLPKDVTGSTFELYIAGFDNRGKAVVVTPADGTVNISVGHELTSQMRGSVAYELVEIYADRTRKTILGGLMKIETPCDDESSNCNCHSCGCRVDDCQCKDPREIVPCNPTGVISLNGRTGAVLIDDLIPQANTTVAGIVKVDGVTVKIDANGVLSASITNTGGANGTPYVLPAASTTQMGGVIVGAGLRVAGGGVISAPIAVPGVVGLVKPGSMISILADGTIDVAATPAHTHLISQVSGLQADLDGKADIYRGKVLPSVLPIGNTTQLGGLKPDGTTVTVDPDGTIHAVTVGITGGTVTSVGLDLSTTAGNIFSVTGSPITKAGNLTLGLDNQPAHMVFAGPAYGAPTAPTFRVLTADDISDATAIGQAIIKAATISSVTTMLGLANVSLTGSYRDLADKPVIPANYTLPTASTITLGGVKIDGTTIKIDANGTISGSTATPYVLPIANLTTLGGVKQGANTTIDANGAINVMLPVSAGTYTLPPANATTLGGVKQGGNVTIDPTGLLSVNLTGHLTSTVANTLYQPILPNTKYAAGQALAQDPTWAGEFQGDITVDSGKTYAVGIGTSGGTAYTGGFYFAEPIGADMTTAGVEVQSATSDTRIERRYQKAGVQTKHTSLILKTDDISFGLEDDSTATKGIVKFSSRTVTVDAIAPVPEVSGLYKGSRVTILGDVSVALSEAIKGTKLAEISLVSNATDSMARLIVTGSLLKTDDTIATLKDLDSILPITATANQVLTHNGTGWIAANANLPVATSVTLGGVKKGPNVTISATGEIDVNMPSPAGTYTLPIATPSILGGVKPSGNITVNANGFMDVAVPSAAGTYVLPSANATRLGGIVVGANLSITAGGILSVNLPANYTLPIANATGLGGVKQGANVTIDAAGLLSVNLPAAANLTPYLTEVKANSTFQPRMAHTSYGNITTLLPAGGGKTWIIGEHVDLTTTTKFYWGQRGYESGGIRNTPQTYRWGGYTLDGTGKITGEDYIESFAGSVNVNACFTNAAFETIYGQVQVQPGTATLHSSNGTVQCYVRSLGNEVELKAGSPAEESSISLTTNGAAYAPSASVLVNSNSLLNKGQMDVLYLSKPATATANQVLTYNGTAWNAANAAAGGLTQVQANLLYQPVMKGATYTNSITIPALTSGINTFEGEIYKDLAGTQGSSGANATFLSGVIHHATMPGIPFGYVTGGYFTEPATGAFRSQRTFVSDSDSTWLMNYDPSGNSQIRLRRNGQLYLSTSTASNGKTTTVAMSDVGLLYTEPANVPIANNMMLNKGQMDKMYLPIPANATVGQIIMSNGTSYGPAAFGKMVLTDAPTITWLADPLKVAVLEITSSRVMAFPTGTGLIPGATYNLIVVQKVGSAALSWDTKYFFPNKSKPVLSTAINSIDIFSFIYDGTNMYGTMQKSFGTGV